MASCMKSYASNKTVLWRRSLVKAIVVSHWCERPPGTVKAESESGFVRSGLDGMLSSSDLRVPCRQGDCVWAGNSLTIGR